MNIPGANSANGRADAFSDGVFAIAITLLAFNLHGPELPTTMSAQGLAAHLLGRWPVYLAFLFSFATILIMWVSHHNLCRLLERTDNTWLFLNGLLLMLITIVPFPTSLVGEFLLSPASVTACVVYTGLFFLIAVAFNLVWGYSNRGGLLRPGVFSSTVGKVTRNYYLGPAVYFLASVLAFVSPLLSLALCAAMAVFYAGLAYERRLRPEERL